MKILFIIAVLLPLQLFYKPIGIRPPGEGVIMLDFDGYYSSREINVGNYSTPSKLTPKQKDSVIAQVKKYFSPWDVVITTKDSLFYTYSIYRRVRVVVTNDSIPVIRFGWILDYSGGRTTYISGTLMGDTLASIVSSSSFDETRSIADAIAHEIGHQLGLAHQSKWNGIIREEEYDRGDSLTAPIMGASYWAKRAVWRAGFNSMGVYQDDAAIISHTFKRIH